jgi:hypothetical protein
MPLEGNLEQGGEYPRETYGSGQQDRGKHEEHRRPGRDAAPHQPVGHRDNDRLVREVQAIGAGAECPRHAAVKQTYNEPRARGGNRGEEAADGRSPGQVEPEQIEVRPNGALDDHQHDCQHGGGQRATGPGP